MTGAAHVRARSRKEGGGIRICGERVRADGTFVGKSEFHGQERGSLPLALVAKRRGRRKSEVGGEPASPKAAACQVGGDRIAGDAPAATGRKTAEVRNFQM